MRTVFLAELEKEYSELVQTGKVQILEDVEKLTSKRFSYHNPLYFSGNLSSKLAIVKFCSNSSGYSKLDCNEDFSEYQYKQQNLGKLFIKTESIDDISDKYANDIRTMNYSKPFQIVRLEGNTVQENLQKFVDEKFEIELVPYLSHDFSAKDFIQNYNVCKSLVDRTLSGVFSYPRQYVIFMGDCFNSILKEYISDSERFSFLLTSNMLPNQKFVASFNRITLNYNNTKIIAGIAESFYDENLDEIMLEKYGRESAAIINRGFLLTNPLWKTH